MNSRSIRCEFSEKGEQCELWGTPSDKLLEILQNSKLKRENDERTAVDNDVLFEIPTSKVWFQKTNI